MSACRPPSVSPRLLFPPPPPYSLHLGSPDPAVTNHPPSLVTPPTQSGDSTHPASPTQPTHTSLTWKNTNSFPSTCSPHSLPSSSSVSLHSSSPLPDTPSTYLHTANCSHNGCLIVLPPPSPLPPPPSPLPPLHTDPAQFNVAVMTETCVSARTWRQRGRERREKREGGGEGGGRREREGGRGMKDTSRLQG